LFAQREWRNVRGVAYYLDLSLYRTRPAKLMRPVLNRYNVPASGAAVAEIEVSPLEIAVDPLKKPFPVFTVNCTVTPFVVRLPIDPLIVPVRV